MNKELELVNRVAQSSLITIKPEDFLPSKEIMEFDVKIFLFRELILKEMDFRTSLKNLDWSIYQDRIVAVHCSTDAIIPTWAFMLIGSYLSSVTSQIYYGNPEQALIQNIHERISKTDFASYQDQKIVIKGCSDRFVPASAYLELCNKLMPMASSIMYGEPCSTVPIYKKKLS